MATALDLIKLNDRTANYVVAKALETYGIARHFDCDRAELPDLVDCEPLRAMVRHIVRMAGAVVLSNTANSMIVEKLPVPEGLILALGDMATDLDLFAVEHITEA